MLANGKWIVTEEDIQKNISKKLLLVKKHPVLDYFIYNYSQNATMPKQFDEVLSEARGMIVDSQKNIVARPFKKFWHTDQTQNLPQETPRIFRKYDGSLIISYDEAGKPAAASRGSFDSPQAIWATNWLRERYKLNDFVQGHTYLFEAIYPENKILSRLVGDYGDFSGLVLLAVVNIENGSEMDFTKEGERLGIKSTEVFDFNSIEDVIAHVKKDTFHEEGFVAYYPSTGLRVKIKSDHYEFRHRVAATLDEKHLWGWFKRGYSAESLHDLLPTEKRTLVCEYRDRLFARQKDMLQQTKLFVASINKDFGRPERDKYITAHANYPALALAVADGEDTAKALWTLTKPE